MAALVLAIALAIAVLVAGLWLEHRTPVTLPTLSDAYAALLKAFSSRLRR